MVPVRASGLILPLSVSFALALGMSISRAQADDLGTLDPGQTLSLPLDLNALEGEIAIEIGALDVTEFAQIVEGGIVIALGGLVDAGSHEVTVYLFQGDAVEIIETFSFTLGSGAVPGVSDLSDGWSVEVEATHEADLRRLNSQTQLEGSSSGQIRVTNGAGTVTGYLGYLTSTRRDQQIDRKPFNFTDYALSYEETRGGTTVNATMGHQALSFDRVLVDGINRRGLSFSVARTDERLRMDVFALRSQDALGAANFTGLEDPQDQMFGGRLAFRPMSSNDLTVTVQSYSGTGTRFGETVSGSGNGVSIGLDGTARDGRLRYGAHLGVTRWDEDSKGPLAPTTGEATWLYADYDVMSPAASASGRQLTFGMAYEAVDADFFSLANPSLPAGNETWRLTADYSADRLWLGLLTETRETNFGGDPALERDRLNYIALDGTYDLQAGRLFSTRTLRFGASIDWQERLLTPPAAIAPQDFYARTAYAGLDLGNDKTTWSLGYTIDDLNDLSAFDEDELSHLFSANVTWRPTSETTLTGYLGSTYLDGGFEDWWTHEARFTLDHETRSDWSLGLELALTQSDDPLADEGGFLQLEAARPVGRNAEMVVYGSWGDGPYALESATSHDAVIGILFQASTKYPG